MGDILSARASIMDGHKTGTQVLAGLEQQKNSLEEVSNGLSYATEGSNQPEADQARAQLADAVEKIGEAQQQVAMALDEFEGIAQRL